MSLPAPSLPRPHLDPPASPLAHQGPQPCLCWELGNKVTYTVPLSCSHPPWLPSTSAQTKSASPSYGSRKVWNGVACSGSTLGREADPLLQNAQPAQIPQAPGQLKGPLPSKKPTCLSRTLSPCLGDGEADPEDWTQRTSRMPVHAGGRQPQPPRHQHPQESEIKVGFRWTSH